MQKIFDVNNKEDMDLLWSILPDDVVRILKACYTSEKYYGENNNVVGITNFFNINWRDKTEITRPIPEITKQDIGKLCMFSYPQEDESKVIGILRNIKKTTDGKNCYKMYGSRLWYIKCRRLTKQEIEELY